MKAPLILLTTMAFFCVASPSNAQDAEPKPVSKPADKAKKADDSKKKDKPAAKPGKDMPVHKKIGLELGALKEVKGFLERINKAAMDVLGGENPTKAFGTMGVEAEDGEQMVQTLKELRDAGAHKLIFTVVETYISIGVPGKEGVSIKGLLLFSKGRVLLFPGKLRSYEEDYKPRGESVDELPKDVAFLSVLGDAMRKKAKEAKRSKNFPFVKKEDFDLFTPLFKKSMTRERWAEDLKKQASDRTKFFIKLKSKDKVEMHYDIDDALFLVEDKNGKGIGALSVDFDLGKNDITIQFKRFRPKQ